MRIIAQLIEQNLTKLKWEPPVLNISPVTPFIKDSFWLQQMTESSEIKLQLNDGSRISLSNDHISIRKFTDKNQIVLGFDEELVLNIKKAVATFYSRVSSIN